MLPLPTQHTVLRVESQEIFGPKVLVSLEQWEKAQDAQTSLSSLFSLERTGSVVEFDPCQLIVVLCYKQHQLDVNLSKEASFHMQNDFVTDSAGIRGKCMC